MEGGQHRANKDVLAEIPQSTMKQNVSKSCKFMK